MLSKSVKMQAAAGLAAATVFSAMVVQTSRAAFNDTYTPQATTWDSGKVDLAENTTKTVHFTPTANMVPGQWDAACITVNFQGDVASTVKLHGAITTAGLDPHLTYTVDLIGATAAANVTNEATCNSAAGTNLFTNTLTNFASTHTNFTNGLNNLGDGTAAWTPSTTESKMLRLKVLLKDENTAQDKNVTATFTWEAQNNLPA